jgi:hypothetical protein
VIEIRTPRVDGRVIELVKPDASSLPPWSTRPERRGTAMPEPRRRRRGGRERQPGRQIGLSRLDRQLLIDVRRARGWTRTRLAREVGFPVEWVCQFEEGNRGVCTERRAALESVLGEDLFTPSRPLDVPGA